MSSIKHITQGVYNKMGCMDRIMLISSRSNPDEIHRVEYLPVTNTFICDCPGFKHRGHCWHIDVFEPAKKTLKEANKR